METSKIKQYYQSDRIARDYDNERFSSFSGRTFDRLEKRAIGRVVDHVRRHIPNPRTLDAPCGTGRITELLLEQELSVLGGDISTAMIDVARKRCESFGDRATFQQLDLEHLDLPDSSFDLATCIRLFHHLTSQQRMPILKELARVSARFVLTNYSLSSPYYRLRRHVKRRLDSGVSRTNATWPEIIAEASAAGLQVCKTQMVLPGVSEDIIVLLKVQ